LCGKGVEADTGASGGRKAQRQPVRPALEEGAVATGGKELPSRAVFKGRTIKSGLFIIDNIGIFM